MIAGAVSRLRWWGTRDGADFRLYHARHLDRRGGPGHSLLAL